MGLEVGLEDGEGLGIADMSGEGVPEPGSCPGECSDTKTAEFGCVGGEERGTWVPSPRATALVINKCLLVPQGRLAGVGGEDLPTIVLVAHYDAFGVAPVHNLPTKQYTLV